MSRLYFKNPIGGEKADIYIETKSKDLFPSSSQNIERDVIEDGRPLIFTSDIYNSDIGHLIEWFNDSGGKKIDMFLMGGINGNSLYRLSNCYVKSIFNYGCNKRFTIAWGRCEEVGSDELKEYFADSGYRAITEEALCNLGYVKITNLNPCPSPGRKNYVFRKGGIHIFVLKSGNFIFDWVSGNTILKDINHVKKLEEILLEE